MADAPGADNSVEQLPGERQLALLQLSTLLYYLRETNPDNGLVRDKTDPNAPVSIAAVGMALASSSAASSTGTSPQKSP